MNLVYTNECMYRGKRRDQLRDLTKMYGEFDIRRTDWDTSFRKEAESHNTKVPFAITDKKIIIKL